MAWKRDPIQLTIGIGWARRKIFYSFPSCLFSNRYADLHAIEITDFRAQDTGGMNGGKR